jgi:hypothetical protein
MSWEKMEMVRQNSTLIKGLTINELVKQLAENRVKSIGSTPPVAIIQLQPIVDRPGSDVMVIPELMDALRQYVFDVVDNDKAFKQAIHKMISQPQSIEAILSAA